MNLKIFFPKIAHRSEMSSIRIEADEDPFRQFGRILRFLFGHSSSFRTLRGTPVQTSSVMVLISIKAMMPPGVSL